MKKTIFALIGCLLLMVCAGESQADGAGKIFGNLTTAEAAGAGNADLMGGVGIGDDITSFFGAYKYGLSSYTTLRGKLGLADANKTDAKLCVGVDLAYQLFDLSQDTDKPFDFALSGFFEYVNFDKASLLQLGARTTGSRPILLANNRNLTPYGSVEVRMEQFSVDQGDSDSDVEFGLNIGVAYELGNNLDILGEFQLDGNEGVFLGLEYNIM
jgi:hypothetical protein